MVFLRRSAHSGSEHGQKSRAKLYSSGTRSRKRRRARWHFWRLQLLSEPADLLVQATTYSDRREPHFSYRPQSWAAFRHWFWPSKEREEAGGHPEERTCNTAQAGSSLTLLYKWIFYRLYLPWWRPYETSQCSAPNSVSVLRRGTLHTRHMLTKKVFSHNGCSEYCSSWTHTHRPANLTVQ